MSRLKRVAEVAQEIATGEQFEQFRINATDFLSARERGEASVEAALL